MASVERAVATHLSVALARMQQRLTRYRIRLLLVCALSGFLSLQLFSFMVRLIDDAHFARERLEVANQLSSIRLKLEQYLNSTFYVSRGLEMLIVGLTADGSGLEDHWEEITLWAAEASADIPGLINVGLSDGYIIKFSYPRTRNQKTIGVDYRDLPDQWPAVQRAVRTRLPVVAGPLELIQGGTGLICRVPLFIDRYTGDSNDFIGLVSMVIDYQHLLDSAGVVAAQKTLTLAIRGRDGGGASGGIFLGPGDVFSTEGVVQNIEFLGGAWVIAAKPIGGWSHESPYSRLLMVAGYVLCALGSVIAYLAGLGVIQRRQASREFTRELESRVAERTRQLTQAKEEAERANRAKSEFLTVVTHELRTPLNSIIGLTDLILGMDLAKNQRNLLGKVAVSAGLLLELINNILSFAKMESGKQELTAAPFSLSALLEKISNMFEVAAANQSLSLTTQIAEGLPDYFIGDEAKISQVLINLVGNALKFTSQGWVKVSVAPGERDLSTAEMDTTLRFAVSDTGIGISEAGQQRLFQPFSQVDSSLTRQYQGTGLGLSISRNFIELMHGEIGLQSESGKGSCFWFEVPLQALTHPEPGLMKAPGISIEELLRQAREQLAGSTVILAEDNEFNQILAVNLLEKVGVNALVATNGQEVLDLLATHRVSGILMDIQMPEMDGVTTTRYIRQQQDYSELPIIALTANAMEEDRQPVFAAGMNGFVSKPIKAEAFYQAMMQWFRKDGVYGPSI